MATEFNTVQEEVLAPEQRVKFFKGVVTEGQTIADVVEAISKGFVVSAKASEQAEIDATRDFLNTQVPTGKQLNMIVQIALQLVSMQGQQPQPNPSLDPNDPEA